MIWQIRTDRKWNGTEIGGGIGKGPRATIQTRDARSATQGYRRQHNDKKKEIFSGIQIQVFNPKYS